MKTLATIGDNCVDIYPQLNKAFSGGNAVNVAVYCTRYGIQPGCITWVGDDDYGTKLKQDLARMGVDISHVHTKHGVTAQTQVELHDNDRVFGDYTEGVMADFALSEEDYAWLAQYDIVHAAIWGHAEDAFPQLHAAGKLTAFDFSDKWDSPRGKGRKPDDGARPLAQKGRHGRLLHGEREGSDRNLGGNRNGSAGLF